MSWPYTPEQILSMLTAAGVLVGVMVKGITVILARIDEIQQDNRQRTSEVKAQVKHTTSVIEGKVDTVQEQSNGRLTRIEAELRASRNEGLAMARELSLIGELRRQEETTRRTLAEEVARAAVVAQALVVKETAQALELAHRQAAQQQPPALTTPLPETAESAPVPDPAAQEPRRIIVP